MSQDPRTHLLAALHDPSHHGLHVFARDAEAKELAGARGNTVFLWRRSDDHLDTFEFSAPVSALHLRHSLWVGCAHGTVTRCGSLGMDDTVIAASTNPIRQILDTELGIVAIDNTGRATLWHHKGQRELDSVALPHPEGWTARLHLESGIDRATLVLERGEIRAPLSRPRTFRDDFFGLWVGENGKTLFLEVSPRNTPRHPLVATITPGLTEPPYPASAVAQASDRTFQLDASWSSRHEPTSYHRLDRLIVEAEASITGRTYLLYFCTENEDTERWGDFAWRPALITDPITAIRLHDETGAGFLDAAVWMDDEGHIPWVQDFTLYRKAAPEELATYQDHLRQA